MRAANIHGFGDFSDTTKIKAAGIADQIQPVVTSIDAATGGVVIDWVAPHDGSEPITEYLVEIANDDNSGFFEDSIACGGADPSVTVCIIPKSTLTAAQPYALDFD